MESSPKKERDFVGILRLNKFIPWRGVRKMIWQYLDEFDKGMICMAHNSRHQYGDASTILVCIRRNYIGLMKWCLQQYWLTNNDQNTAFYVAEASRQGNVPALVALKENTDPASWKARLSAWKIGIARYEPHVPDAAYHDVFKWMHEESIRITSSWLERAIEDERHELLQFLIERVFDPKRCVPPLLDLAAFHGIRGKKNALPLLRSYLK